MCFNRENRLMKNIFVTGATGLIGGYLTKCLLDDKTNNVYCLVRPGRKLNGIDRLRNVLNFWNINSNNFKRLFIVEGDLIKIGLGLNTKDKAILQNEIHEIFYCAADTGFNSPLESITKSNVLGLANCLDFFKEDFIQKNKKINYFSTAYVCGKYNGLFFEEDLNKGQDFLKNYDKTKFEAEILVKKYQSEGVFINVYRPPLVIGERETGKVVKFQSLFQAIQLLNREIFEYFPAKNVPSNLVYLDELCKAVILLANRSAKINAVYHVFSNKQIYFEEIINFSSYFLNFNKPIVVKSEDFDFSVLSAVQRKLLENTIFAFNPKVTLSSKVTEDELNRLGFKFSEIDFRTFVPQLEFAVSEKYLNKVTRNEKN